LYISRIVTRPGTVFLISALVSLAACATSTTAATPPADALVITADSSYWVTSDAKGLRMRGEPILIARLDGRFRELYVADDDRSFYNAVFVGQRLFMRDLVRGDSAELMADSVVPRLAREYAAAHPREELLGMNEEGSAKPGTTATADLEILDVHPPYLSYEYHSDVDVTASRGGIDRHASRRGVLDLRTGKAASVETLFGREAADRAVAAAAAEWDTARDSILARHDANGERAQRMLGSLAFDATSFSLDAREREPEVVFAVPALSQRASTPPLALTARPVPAPPWWGAQRNDLPAGLDSARSWGRAQPGTTGARDSSFATRTGANGPWGRSPPPCNACSGSMRASAPRSAARSIAHSTSRRRARRRRESPRARDGLLPSCS